MFDRFTDQARRVLVLAQDEARLLNHDFIGTEHLLLGMLHDERFVAYQALAPLGISLGLVREALKGTIGPQHDPVEGGRPFSPKARKALELALRESLQMGHAYIGTEHLLLGLVREGEGVGAQLLARLGVPLDRVRQQVLIVLGSRTNRDDRRAGVAGELVTVAELARMPVELFSADEAADIFRSGAGPVLLDLRTAVINGVTYESCVYMPRFAELSVGVAAARVTREAFDAYTNDSMPDAEQLSGLGDAATYSPARKSLRLLTGSTLIVISAKQVDDPKETTIAVARRVLENRRQAPS